MEDLKTMFDPRTIALIGASEREGSVGRAVLENLLSGSPRKIFPVNPAREIVLGQKTFPDIRSIPEAVDLAVIVTPAKTVPEIVEGCGKVGVKGLTIISAGFKEVGEEGKRLEKEIIEIRKKYGLRIIGPNCVGVIQPHNGLNSSFLRVAPAAGNIAFISQSGALGSSILDWAVNAHIGFSLFASLGSMIDIDFGDMIDFLGADPRTRSIMLYMEGVGNAKKFMSAARGFARNKPIFIIKPGKFQESARATLSHTGAMAGDDQVYEAAFKRAGVIRVREFGGLFNTASVLDSRSLPRDRRLAIITNAGGFGVMATDALLESGGELARLSPDAIEGLNAILPGYWSKANPVDVLGDADRERFVQAVHICLKDPRVDGVLVIYTPQAICPPEELAASLAELAHDIWKPVLVAFVGGDYVQRGKEILSEHKIPVFDTPEDAVKTYMIMHNYHNNLDLLYETPSELPLMEAPPKNHLKTFIKRMVKEGRTLLTEEESKDLLTNYGIPVTEPYLTRSVEGALQTAARIRYPVVLKIVSPHITHKSDVGGVRIAIRSEGELKTEYAAMLDRVKGKVPQAEITGISVQKMIEPIDYEVIVGAKKDRDFGTVILFGLGGVAAELFQDVSIGLPPLNQILARRMMEETRVYRMLQGFRGRKPADLKALEQLLVNFSNLIVDFPEIVEMDINPVAISDGKPFALDARIIVDPQGPDPSLLYPHLVITPYPTRYTSLWRMSDGSEVTLRPIRPEDEPLEHEMLSSLSPDSLRNRFFSLIQDISHEMLIRFCNIDYDREMAIVAEIKNGERKRIIGIGRLMIEPDGGQGEFAVLVHDAHQGKGLGYKLVDTMIGIGQDKNLDEIYGLVLTENERMLQLTRKMGFQYRLMPGGVTEVRLALK
ncbi:MAG: bifunctional acetate--CoA ligase family protein/GNAT family N-acetyltransferase [Thermodesulfobacteriota bacterium]